MDPPNPLFPGPVRASVSFNDRWDLLRDDILRYWLDDRVKYKDLVEIMKERHNFYATLVYYVNSMVNVNI